MECPFLHGFSHATKNIGGYIVTYVHDLSSDIPGIGTSDTWTMGCDNVSQLLVCMHELIELIYKYMHPMVCSLI